MKKLTLGLVLKGYMLKQIYNSKVVGINNNKLIIKAPRSVFEVNYLVNKGKEQIFISSIRYPKFSPIYRNKNKKYKVDISTHEKFQPKKFYVRRKNDIE